jgi:hypothetical protein
MKKFFRDNKCSKTDILKKVKESFYGKTKEELQEMIKPGKKEKLPVIIVMLISVFVNDPKYEDMDIYTFLDKVLGEKEMAENAK